MKTQEKNSQETVGTVSDNKKQMSHSATLVASTSGLINRRSKMPRKKRTTRRKIVQFDRNSVVHLVNDLQYAINHICSKYGAKQVEVENVKFMSNDLEINGLHVRLPEPPIVKKEMSIIDETNNTIQIVKRKVKNTVKEAVRNVGEYVGREFKQGYRTFKILSQEGDKFWAITRRHKKYLLSSEELDKMKLVA